MYAIRSYYGFTTHPLLYFFDSILGIIFIGYIIVLILKHIFRQEDITLETIYGAIVVYIFIGLIWVLLYRITSYNVCYTKLLRVGRIQHIGKPDTQIP